MCKRNPQDAHVSVCVARSVVNVVVVCWEAMLSGMVKRM